MILLIFIVIIVIINAFVIRKHYKNYMKMKRSWRNNSVQPTIASAELISTVQADYIQNTPNNIIVVEVEQEIDILQSI